VVTVWAQAELAEFFILAGLVVLLARAWAGWRRALLASAGAGAVGLAVWAMERWFVDLGHGEAGVLPQILMFFTKAGAFVFGSGLAIVPFLHQGVVQQFGWLTEQQFLDAVAVAMITPGPVVITVAFIGYLVASFTGACLAAVGIFLPVYVFTVVPAPWFKRNRDNPQLKAFVHGTTAAATGAITGSVVVLAQRAVYDVPTAAIALAGLAVLWRFKVPEPVLVLAAAALGLVLWPLVRAGGSCGLSGPGTAGAASPRRRGRPPGNPRCRSSRRSAGRAGRGRARAPGAAAAPRSSWPSGWSAGRCARCAARTPA
jgi:chromate transporter